MPTTALAPPTDRYPSAEAARAAHTALLTEMPGDPGPGDLDRVAEFMRRAVATGVVLDAPDDRKEVQALVDYWAASLVTQAREAGGHQAALRIKPATTVLAPFDVSTLRDAAAAAEDWLRRQPPDVQTVARRIMLRLVRLQAGVTRFEPAPTVRAALYDFATPAEARDVLGGLAAAGVVRVTPGDREEMDRVVLRSPDLMTGWPTLAGWLKDRAAFRERAAAWDAGGRRSVDPAPTDADLDEVRLYHDRDANERAYIDACRQRDRRRRELLRGGVVVLAIVLGVVIPLAVVSVVQWGRAVKAREREAAERRAAEQATETAKKATNELARQELLVRTVQIVRTLAEIGAARTDAELGVALTKWKDLATQIKAHEAARTDRPPYFTMFLERQFQGTADRDGLELAARKAKSEADAEANPGRRVIAAGTSVPVLWYTTSTWTGFNVRVLQTAHQLRNELLATSDDELTAIRAAAYPRVEWCVREMLKTLRDKPFDEAAPLVREFWLNYWGDLGLVEGGAVARGMKNFGDKLRLIEERLPAFAAADGFYSFERNVKERKISGAPNPLSFATTDPAKRYSTNKLYRDYSRLVYLDELDQLNKLAEPLLSALAKERDEPILPH